MTSAQHLPKPPCKELIQPQLECGCIWPTYHPAAGYCFGMTTQALLLRAEHRSPVQLVEAFAVVQLQSCV